MTKFFSGTFREVLQVNPFFTGPGSGTKGVWEVVEVTDEE